MASSAYIQAGRAAISVVLDDAQVQPQLQALSARLKTASAGMSAATLPTLGAESAGPGREAARQFGDLNAQFRDGLRSPSEYAAAMDRLARSFLATATPAQALGVQFAQLDAELASGRITGDEYQQQLTTLTAEFTSAAGPVERLQGQMVALDRDLRTGAISESEYKAQLAALHREFTAAASPADRYAAEIATLDAQLTAGHITQDQYTAAVKRAKTALQETEAAASKKTSVLGSLGTQIATLAAGYVSWTAILQLAGQALEFVRQETEKAKNSQDALVDSRRRLAQVATSEQDLAAMLERADKAAMKFGVDRKKAQEVMFQARSEGFEKDFESILQNSTVVDPTAASGVAGQVPALFRQNEQISSEQAVSGTLMAAQQSRLDFEAIARSLPQAAEGVAQAKGSFAETAGALGVLAGRFKSGDTAAERIKLFSAKLAQNADTAGLGLIGGFDALVAAGADAQKEFLGESVELRAAFQIMGEEMPTIREQAKKIQEELDKIRGGGESMVDKQRKIAEADPAEQARLDRTRAAIERERANESQFAKEGSARQAAIDRQMAEAKRRGAGGAEQFAKEKAGGLADFFGAGSGATANAMGAAGAALDPGRALAGITAAEAETARLKEETAAMKKRIADETAAQAAAPPPMATLPQGGMPLATMAPAPMATLPQGGMPLAPMVPPPMATLPLGGMPVGDLVRRAAADAEMAARTLSYAEQFAQTMEDASKGTPTVTQTKETAGYAADFAAAMEGKSKAQDERMANDPEEQLRRRIEDMQQQKVASELDRKARLAVEGPKQSVAGTFSGWRLGDQFGGKDQVPKEQLVQLKAMAGLSRQTLEAIQLLGEKEPTYG